MKRSDEWLIKNSHFGFNRNIPFTGITSFLTDTSVKMVSVVKKICLNL